MQTIITEKAKTAPVETKGCNYAEFYTSFSGILREKGWELPEIGTDTIIGLPRLENGKKTLTTVKIAYGIGNDNNKAYYIDRLKMAVNDKATTTGKTADKEDASKTDKEVAAMYAELRDTLRTFTLEYSTPSDAEQIYFAFLAKSVNSKSALTDNGVFDVLSKGFTAIKAEIEKARKENAIISNTRMNTICKEIVREYGGTIIAKANTKELATSMTSILYPTLRIDAKTGEIKPYSASWFKAYREYALEIALAAIKTK